jgi:hypothetical protein
MIPHFVSRHRVSDQFKVFDGTSNVQVLLNPKRNAGKNRDRRVATPP